MKVLFGIDPSFRRTGIACYCEGKIVVTESRFEANDNKSFEQIVADVYERSSEIEGVVQKLEDEMSGRKGHDVVLLSECPPPTGNFAPGLYALDTTLFIDFRLMGYSVYRVYPTYIGHVHGKRSYTKSESVSIAKEILSYYDVEIKTSRLSHDESEAVIFLARNMARHGFLKKEISDKYKGLLSEKEAEVNL